MFWAMPGSQCALEHMRIARLQETVLRDNAASRWIARPNLNAFGSSRRNRNNPRRFSAALLIRRADVAPTPVNGFADD
jgi:hypothetical protein